MTTLDLAPDIAARPAGRPAPDMAPLVLCDAVLVLPDRVVERGWLAVADGRIAEIGEGAPPEPGLSLAGDTLVPGLVELHTDHLESHYAPRPHVRWHAASAVFAYDAQIASAGITTVFDSLRVGSDADSASLGADVWTLAEAIEGATASGYLRASHRTHLRCEIASEDVIDQAIAYAGRFPVHLMSLMDHTPGQRQFRDLAAWRRFYTKRAAMAEEDLQRFIRSRLALHERLAATHRAALVDLAARTGAVLASHDDATEAHVDEAVRDRVAIAEFPTTLEAAGASHAAGLKVLMGGPNVVRGGSHSGNVSALALAEAGVLDILSSDYVPSSLLMGAFELARLVPGLGLPAAVRTVTLAPAQATGLADRGALEPGLRADLVRVARLDTVPVVRAVWREGRQVA